MYVSVINIQDPGALALISWSRKNSTFAKEINLLLVPCAFFVLKNYLQSCSHCGLLLPT